MSKEILPIIQFNQHTLNLSPTTSKTQFTTQRSNLIYKTLFVSKEDKLSSINSSIKTDNQSYDHLINQIHQYRQLRLPPSQLINQLRRQKMNVDKIPRPKAKKLQKPSFSININTKDKNQLQKQICNYVSQANKLQQYKLSAIHSRRQDFKPYFNFQEFSFMDEIFPHANLVKKKFGLNEQIMFRNSMGLEKVILQRIIQTQEDE